MITLSYKITFSSVSRLRSLVPLGFAAPFTLITKGCSQVSCSILGFLRTVVQGTHLLPLIWHFSLMDLNSQWTFIISCSSFSKHIMPKIETSKILLSGLQHSDKIPINELKTSFRSPFQVWLMSPIMYYFIHNAITDNDTNLPTGYIKYLYTSYKQKLVLKKIFRLNFLLTFINKRNLSMISLYS